jgi:alkaline phosphatase
LPWYYLGKLVNENRLSSFLDKRGKYIGITSNDLIKSKRWFDKYGVSLVFWGRLVPGIRTLISVPAGMELMPLRKFLIWTSLGSLIWVALLTYAGFAFGENYQIIETYLDQFKFIIKPMLFLIFIYFLIKFFILIIFLIFLLYPMIQYVYLFLEKYSNIPLLYIYRF